MTTTKYRRGQRFESVTEFVLAMMEEHSFFLEELEIPAPGGSRLSIHTISRLVQAGLVYHNAQRQA